MSHGEIVKLVRSYGSRWGRIQPSGVARDIFFNRESLAGEAEFEELSEGQLVEFEEEPDRANGTHAVRVAVTDLPALATVAHRAQGAA